MTSGYCYVAQAGDLYKFGWSDDPRQRVFSLSGQIGQHVTLIGFVKGGRVQEGRLHELLRRFRVHGEWYHKNHVTDRVAALFPRKGAFHKTNRDLFAAVRSDRDEARELMRQCLEPGRPVLAQVAAIGASLGMGRRRARAIWGREARVVLPAEMASLRALADKAKAIRDREAA